MQINAIYEADTSQTTVVFGLLLVVLLPQYGLRAHGHLLRCMKAALSYECVADLQHLLDAERSAV